jgi:hypothetical protein
MNKIYVIGNGFDKLHGLPCGYADFSAWLQGNRPDVYRNLNRIYGECNSDCWKEFEKSLVSFELDDYPYDVTRSDLEKLKCGLYEAVGEWAKTIGLPEKETAIDVIDRNAIFFTLDYTRTLEDFYGIDEDRIVHLHGSVGNDDIVFGHDSMGDGVSDDDLEDAREIGMHADLYRDMVHVKMSQEFADVMRKPVARIIEEHENDFNALAGIDEIIILGFSYSEIDLPYLKRIIEVTGQNIKAVFGFHTDEDMNRAAACVEELGVSYCEMVRF